ncbi:hypothetical protein GCM10027024_16460 [Microbacterium insulae]
MMFPAWNLLRSAAFTIPVVALGPDAPAAAAAAGAARIPSVIATIAIVAAAVRFIRARAPSSLAPTM